jgi:hypothetical protein
MGQIVIDIPSPITTHYRIVDEARAVTLLEELTSIGAFAENDLTDDELEEIADVASSSRALREIAETGMVHGWDDVKSELGRE